MYIILLIYFLGTLIFYCSVIYFIFIFKIKFNYYCIMFYLYPNEYDDIWHCIHYPARDIESIKLIDFTGPP